MLSVDRIKKYYTYISHSTITTTTNLTTTTTITTTTTTDGNPVGSHIVRSSRQFLLDENNNTNNHTTTTTTTASVIAPCTHDKHCPLHNGQYCSSPQKNNIRSSLIGKRLKYSYVVMMKCSGSGSGGDWLSSLPPSPLPSSSSLPLHHTLRLIQESSSINELKSCLDEINFLTRSSSSGGESGSSNDNSSSSSGDNNTTASNCLTLNRNQFCRSLNSNKLCLPNGNISENYTTTSGSGSSSGSGSGNNNINPFNLKFHSPKLSHILEGVKWGDLLPLPTHHYYRILKNNSSGSSSSSSGGGGNINTNNHTKTKSIRSRNGLLAKFKKKR